MIRRHSIPTISKGRRRLPPYGKTTAQVDHGKSIGGINYTGESATDLSRNGG